MSPEIELIRNVGQGSKDAWALVPSNAFRERGLDPREFSQQCTVSDDTVRVRISPTSYLYLEGLPPSEALEDVVCAVPFADVNDRPRISTTDFALLHGARTPDGVRTWARARGLRSQAKNVGSLRLPERTDGGPSVFFDGTDEQVRRHLEGVFGSDAFYLVGDEVVLELPLTDKAKQPLPTGETVHIRFRAPSDWSIQAAERGSWWHVVPDGSEQTLCTIDLASWPPPQRDDAHAITCPWCRARMTAVEIAAPPGSLSTDATERPTLHAELQRILREHGGWMTTAQLAEAVNEAGRYRRGDGATVDAFQIHGRTRNYPKLFERDGSRVSLRADAP